MTDTQNLARPFTEVDWYGYAGCVRWNVKGQPVEPLLREVNDSVVVVADSNGFGAVSMSGGEEFGESFECYHFPLKVNPVAAEAFLNGLPSDLDHAKLIELGFQLC